jgi:hypothetical protein
MGGDDDVSGPEMGRAWGNTALMWWQDVKRD